MSTWTQARSELANLASRKVPADDPRVVAAKLKLKTARAEDYIRTLVESAPPLSDEQRQRLALLLTDGAPHTGEAAA